MTENNSCPVPIDVQDFLFKQASIGQICERFANIPISSNLIAVDTKRGLLYIGHENKLLVVKPGNDSNPEWKIELDLPDRACRVQISCDCSFLAVTFSRPSALIFDASSINRHKLDALHEIRLSANAGDIFVSDLKWNPAIPELLCSVTSDHTIGCFQVSRDKKVGVTIVGMERIQGVEALCVSWSPKGKQLVVGCKNGDIIQLKPELKPARHLSGPKPSEGVIISILWVSNYQFCACYYLPDEQRISVMIVDAPKGVQTPKFTNYEDVTYGTGSYDNLYYYFEHIPEWGLIIAASSHSTEVAVLGSTDNGTTWIIWQMVEGGAVQLPLNRKQGLENYPIGMTVDRSPTQRLPWTADSTLPNPIPILRILVTSGQLCSYHMVNLREKAPDICSPPSEIISAPAIPRPSIGPEVSFNLPSGATSTPRTNKASLETQLENPKISNMFGDAAAPSMSFQAPSNKAPQLPIQVDNQNMGFSAPPEIKTGGLFTAASVKTNLFQQDINKMPPINPQIKQTPIPQQPAAQLEAKPPGFATRPEVRLEPQRTQVVQPEIKVTKEPAKEQPPPAYRYEEPKLATKELPVYDDALCLRAYFDEQDKFEKELQSKLELPNWQCGTEEERNLLVKKTEEIDEFLRELKETTNSLASDIAYLKALLLQSFAWLEESKSKNDTANSGSRARAEGTKLADLQRLYYYTQSQLVQATKVLDLEWAEHKNHELTRMKIPSLEVIYQSLIRHNQIIAQEKKNIEDLAKKWRNLARGGSSSLASLDRSMASLNLSRSSSSALVSDTAIDLRCKLIATNTNNFSREKQMKLRDLLAETAPMIVRAVRPSAVQDRLEATLSALAAQKPIEAAASKTRTPKSVPTDQQKIAAQQKMPDSLKSKSHYPLSSLDNFVSGIGGGMASLPSLSKSPGSAAPFSALAAKSQLTPPQPKAKENVAVPLVQRSQQAQTMSKGLAKMDSISFGKPALQTTPEPQASKESLNKTPEPASKFPMFPANTFGRLGSPEALSGAAAGASSMTTLTTVPKATFSFSSTTAPPSTPQNFAAPKLDNTSVFKFSSIPSAPASQSAPAAAAGTLDFSSLNFGNRSGLTITAISDAKAATSAEPAAPATFAFGKTSAPQQQSSIFGQSSATVATALPSAMSSLFGKSAAPAMPGATVSYPEKSSAAAITTAATAAQAAATSSTPSAASAPTSTAASSTPAFGATSLFGEFAGATPTFNFKPPSTQASVAASSSTAATTTASASGISFGNLSSTAPSSAPGFAGILGATSALSFGTPSTGTSITPAFGTSTIPTANIFGSTAPATTSTTAAAATPAPSTTSIFGKSDAPAAPPSATNIFGGATEAAPAATTAATSTSLFGSTPATSTASIFGGQTSISSSSSTSTENSFFSAKPSTTTTATTAAPAASIFGGGNTSTPGASIFGSSSSAAPVFGATTVTTQASSTASTPNVSVFGSSSSAAPVFGATTITTQASSVAPTPNASIFGSSTSSAPVFGASTATTQASNIFGGGTTQSSTSIFGSGGAAPTGASIFGGSSSTPAFGAAATTAGSTTPSAGIFGTTSSTFGSIFGGGGAATAATGNSVFGASAAPTASIFGGGAATTTTTPSSSMFGGPAVTTASGSIFGAAASSSQPSTGNIFGQAATNPTAAGAGSMFGGPPALGATNSTFGDAVSPGGGMGANSVFGGSTFGGAPAFGGAPVFGSPGGNPTFGTGFGSSPSFGGAPASGFGTAPVFGSTSPTASATTSPSKVFGSNTFETLGAQQGGLSFGSLAQSTDNQKPAFGGSSSFSSWR